jgi:hypothetical protein
MPRNELKQRAGADFLNLFYSFAFGKKQRACAFAVI